MQRHALLLLKTVLTIILICSLVHPILAQMRVGQPSGSPDASAALEIQGGPYAAGSPFRGLAPPNVALIRTSLPEPVRKPLTGLLIYNTTTQQDVSPGYYYWEGTKWLRLLTGGGGGARVAADAGQPLAAYTMSEVRSLTTTPETIFLVDLGREGLFRYDANDITADNGGTVLVTVSSVNPGRHYRRIIEGAVNVKWFGAKGDGLTDDTQPIQDAINSGCNSVLFPPTVAHYKVTNLLAFTNVNKIKLIATGAKILNNDLTKQTWLFQNSRDIEIEGGAWGYASMPTANGQGSQHVFQFQQCQRVLVNNIHILNSPEIGIAITNSNQVTVQNSLIEHTWRDGIYSRYSANVSYLNNKLNNIKDDALSFHDKDNLNPGIDGEKNTLKGYGYNQATNCLIVGNTIENSYQGIVSVGGSQINVTSNTIINTVNSGIALYNQKNDDPAGVNRSLIATNKLYNTCATTEINGYTIVNNGQSGPGRAAIFVGSTGDNNEVGRGPVKHLTNIQVVNNAVYSSGANAFWSNLVDGLQLTDNLFQNCSGANPTQSLGGIPVEINSTTSLYASNNIISDTRGASMYVYGYQLSGVTGYSDNWHITNYITGELISISSDVASEVSKKSIPVQLPIFTSNGTTNFNTLIKAGVMQVAGSGWSLDINAPTHVATAGNLEIAKSGDVITQRYTDYLGNQTVRVLNGISSGNWSSWSPLPITSSNLKQGTSAIQISPGATAFAFPHGAGFTPTGGHVTAASAGADQSLIQHIAFDPTSVIIYYKQHIASGISLQWHYNVYK